MKKQTFPIVGMHCAACKTLIEKMVRKLDGIENVDVNYASEKMFIEYDDEKVSLEDIKKAVASAGSYKLVAGEGEKTVLASPTEAKKMEEIKSHEMSSHDHAKMLREKDFQKLKRTLIWVGIGVIPFAILMGWMLLRSFIDLESPMMFFGKINFENGEYSIHLAFLLQFLIATPILFIGGRQFFQSAYAALKVRSTNMDTLIVLGTTAAWIFSTLVTFFPKLFSSVGEDLDVFFEASVFIVFFMLFGRFLEARAKSKANDAIKKLLELQAKEATVIRDGKEIKVPVEQVHKGDIIIVKPGEKIPVDGEITEGKSTIDESMVTGESMPIDKEEGNNVIGSTINKTGAFKFKAEKVGADTMLSQIIKMVEEAQGSTAPIQKLADKISSVFVPIVVMIAIFSFLFWTLIASSIGLIDESVNSIQLATYIATTVLIIACPCALGLATPTALIVGTGKAALRGILIKDAESLQIANKIKTIVFDKTGTLTKGEPEVEEFKMMDKIEESGIRDQGEDYGKFFLSLAHEIEKRSEHPLSEAIVNYAKESVLDSARTDKNVNVGVNDFEAVEGKGVRAMHEGKEVLIGNLRLMRDENVMKCAELEIEADRLKEKAKTVVYYAYDGKNIAIFAIADAIKESSKETIEQLHKLGITTVMLTGDNEQTAKSIASQLNIDKIYADVLPQDKLRIIKELQLKDERQSKEDHVIAMVGDGINDAPALAQADIGIAMGTGTDVAIESGDIVLVKGTLDRVIEAIKISKDTMSIIRQNLGWAFGYNTIGIPVAAGLLYASLGLLLSPIFASAAMAFSSISVLTNSLRLKTLSDSNKVFSTVSYYLGVFSFVILVVIGSIVFGQDDINASGQEVHYHAVFELYKDNNLVDFSATKYMHSEPCNEEEEEESSEHEQEEKAHLHDNIGDVVHAHRDNAIWEDLFENLDYHVDQDIVGYVNGEKVKDILEYQIKDEDSVLLLIGENTNIENKLDDMPGLERIEETESYAESCGAK